MLFLYHEMLHFCYVFMPYLTLYFMKDFYINLMLYFCVNEV